MYQTRQTTRIKPFRALWLGRPRLLNNPVIKRELIERLRKGSSFVYLLLFVGMFFIFILAQWQSFMDRPLEFRSRHARTAFTSLNIFIWLFMLFLLPAISATRINMEFEHDSWDLLRTTHLSTASIVLGKFLSAMLFLGLLMLSAIPFYSNLFMMGGIGPDEVIFSFALLLECAIIITLIGLVCSAASRKSTTAITMCYVLSIGYLVLPVFLFILGFVLVLRSSNPFANQIQEYLAVNFFPIFSPYFLSMRVMENIPSQYIFVSKPILYWLHGLFGGVFMLLLVYLCYGLLNRQTREKRGFLARFFRNDPMGSSPQTDRAFSPQPMLPDSANPIYRKELIEQRGQGGRPFIVTGLLFALGMMIVLYRVMYSLRSNRTAWDDSLWVWPILIVPVIILPYAVSAFRHEFDRGAWDILRITTLSPLKIITGKFLAGLRLFSIRFLAFYVGILLLGVYGYMETFLAYSEYFTSLSNMNWLRNEVFRFDFWYSDSLGLLIPTLLLSLIWAVFYLSAGTFLSFWNRKTNAVYVQMVLLALALNLSPWFLGGILFNWPSSNSRFYELSGVFSPLILYTRYWSRFQHIPWNALVIMHMIFFLGISFLLLKLTLRKLN